MKKRITGYVLACLLCLCVIFALAACGGDKGSEETTTSAAETTDGTVETTVTGEETQTTEETTVGGDTTADDETQTTEETTVPSETETESKTETETETETVTETETETEETSLPIPPAEPTVFDYEGVAVKSLTVAGEDIGLFTVIYPAAADGMDDDDDDGYDEAIVADKTAAIQLAKYLSLATGKEIKVSPDSETFDHEIAVGHTTRDTDSVRALRQGLGGDGYLLLCEGGRFYISGDTARGTPNGVFSFLDDWIGWRFFTQTMEKVLPSDSIDIPAGLSFTFVPKFEYRTTSWWTVNNDEPNATDDMNANFFGAKCKINTANDARQLNGLGGGFPKAASGDHNLGRLSGTGDGLSANPCFTSDEILEKVYQNLKRDIRNREGCTMVVVSQNDSDSFCNCANCRTLYREEGYSGALIYFLNRLCDRLAQRDEFKDLKIRTLAYGPTLEPPKTIKPNEHIVIMLAPITSCYSHDITDPDCPQNVAYYNAVQKWSELTDNSFYLWDYTTNFAYFLSPFPDFTTLINNSHFYAEHNVTGVYSQANSMSESGEFGELRTYLVGKLLWEPDMSEERYYQYMDEFLQAYYGEGWIYIRQYIDAMCERAKLGHMEVDSDLRAPFCLPRNEDNSVDFTFLEEMEQLWVYAAATSGEEYQMNIEKSALQIEFAGMWLRSQTVVTGGDIQAFAKKLRQHRITWITSGLEATAGNIRLRIPKNTDY